MKSMPSGPVRKNIFFSVIASFLWILPNFAAADYFRVGNGGEGVLLETGLFCRDLYDYDLHATAWVGSETDSLFLENIRHWNPLNLSEQEMVTLAQKLTDLNKAKAFLGDDIFAAMMYFNWQPTDQNLELINPDERRRELKEEQRVALANRFLQNILVNEKGFQQLDSANKSALVLHEVIYALMAVNPGNLNPHKQSLSATRQIVAGLFDQKNINSEYFLNLVDKYLNIKNPAMITAARLGQKSSDTFAALGLSDANQIPFTLSPENSLNENNHLLTDACDQAFDNDRYIKLVTYRYPGTRVISETMFKNSNGTEQIALAVRYLPSDPDMYQALIFSPSECSDFVKGTLTSLWLNTDAHQR